MSAPRLEIDLGKLHDNARTLVERLAARGIRVTGITKATLGSPAIARALLSAGVVALGDSRIENIETLRRAGVPGPMVLVRSPMRSQVSRVVRHADTSFNTEPEIVRLLSVAARRAGRTHGIVLMVELGDLREGIMPDDLERIACEVLRLPNVALRGIGANLACRSGVAPGQRNMAELSALAESLETALGCRLGTVSGGNSANLGWALGGGDTGRIDDLRLGEAILLGRDPLHGRPIDGLHGDAITLVAEVIESKRKPSLPWGELARNAFGELPVVEDRGDVWQALLAVGRQDTDADGLRAPAGIEIAGASSDHLVVRGDRHALPVGAEIRFTLGYGALLRAMTSPFVARRMCGRAAHAGSTALGEAVRRVA